MRIISKKPYETKVSYINMRMTYYLFLSIKFILRSLSLYICIHMHHSNSYGWMIMHIYSVKVRRLRSTFYLGQQKQSFRSILIHVKENVSGSCTTLLWLIQSHVSRLNNKKEIRRKKCVYNLTVLTPWKDHTMMIFIIL